MMTLMCIRDYEKGRLGGCFELITLTWYSQFGCPRSLFCWRYCSSHNAKEWACVNAYKLFVWMCSGGCLM